MTQTPDPDNVILGGDTPFMMASDAVFYTKPGHKATRFMKDGVDHTRLIQLGTLAAAWNQFVLTRSLDTFGEEPREFMREMIAAANTDLRALGIEPLISIGEVERLAPHFGEKKP